ncbi:hypothetical protein E2C01_041260 [Portunus trituberculatus]|uniref:Uncharacterized protein n=1 Tax=Portunus trituberculatus TaxID=210409 RepID=A0A5B7FM47_PORTR|nr:hypothetical protein [Portunus trituberculatus]
MITNDKKTQRIYWNTKNGGTTPSYGTTLNTRDCGSSTHKNQDKNTKQRDTRPTVLTHDIGMHRRVQVVSGGLGTIRCRRQAITDMRV